MMMNMIMITALITMTNNQEHPMKMMTLIMMLAVTSSLEIYMVTKNSWLSIMMILAFVGGLMVVYSFMIAMIPNEKEKKSKNKTKLMIMMVISMWLMQKKTELNKSMDQMFLLSWMSISTSVMLMILCMIMMTEMILNPNKNMKSTK